MNTKKTAKILSLVAVLALVLTTVFAFGITASAETTEVDTVEVTNAAQLSAAMTGAEVTLGDGSVVTLKDGGTIVVANDIVDVAWGNTSSRTSTKSFTLTSGEGGPFTIYRGEKDTTATHNRAFLILGANCTVTLENIILDGMKDYITDTTTSGGAFALTGTGATLILNDGAVIQNFYAKQGGAIYSKGSSDAPNTIIINNGAKLDGNKSSNRGGAVFLDNYATVWMMGGTVSNNQNASQYGGAFQINGTAAQAYIYGGTIEGNSVQYAGTGHGACFNVSNGTLYLVGGTIQNNTAKQDPRIIALYGTTAFVEVGVPTGVTFPEAADAPTGEPLLYYQNDGKPFTFGLSSSVSTQVKITNPLPAGSCVYLTAVPTIAMADAEMTTYADTISNVDGEALLVKVTDTTREGVFTNIVTSLNGTKYFDLSEAVAAANGNALTLEYVKGGAELVAGAYTIDGAGKTFSNTVANKPMITLPEGADVTFTNITLDGNGVTSTANGGALLVDTGAALTLSEGVVISDFTALNGAGIFVQTDGTLVVKDGAIIKDNTATTTTSNQGGGAIYNKGTLTLASCTVSGNIAYKAGAGIVNASGATAYIEDGALITLNLGYGSAVYGGGVRNVGTLIMSGGEISYNATTAPTAGSDTRGAGVHSTGDFWMTGGSITKNVTVGGFGGGVFIGGNFYMLGGEITDNRLAKQGSNTFGPGINLSTDTVDAYFLGGTISGNKYVNRVTPNEDCAVEGRPSIEVKDNGQIVITTYSGGKKYSLTVYASVLVEKPEIMIYANSKPTNVYVGGSIPVAGAPVADGVNGVSNDGTTVTTTNALCIPTAPNSAPTFGYRSGYSTPNQLILNGNLNAGSQVVLPDNFSDTDNYFMTVAEGVVLDKTTLGAIQLNGADAAYNAEVATGKLVWPADACQAYQNAGLQDNIAYRLYWAYRDASNKTFPTVTFDGETVELGTVSSSLAALIKEPYYEGLTYVEVRLAPKQISKTISVVLGGEPKTYTLAGYLDGIKKAGGTLGALVNATLNYCTAAQAYFGETEDRANANYQEEIAGITAASERVLNQFADKNLPLFKSASVVLGDKVSVKIIIKQWVENFQYSVTLGGETYTPTTAYDAENGLYMIVIKNISACDLADRIEVTMTDGENNTATLNYSVLDYAISKQDDTKGGLDYVVKALYAYANAAAAYVAAN